MAMIPAEYARDDDIRYHYETYRGFVFWTAAFVAHVAVILLLLAYFLI